MRIPRKWEEMRRSVWSILLLLVASLHSTAVHGQARQRGPAGALVTPRASEQAGREARKKARKIIGKTGQEEIVSAFLKKYLLLTQRADEEVPAEFWDQHLKGIELEGFLDSFEQTYALKLTDDELDAILKFLDTPAGKSVAGKLPDIVQSLLWSGESKAEKLAIKARDHLRDKGHVPELPEFTAEELDTIASLRTLVRAQAVFREGDKDEDGVLAFAPNLSKLKLSGLIDEKLARGAKGAYTFTLVGGRYDYRCVAMPADATADLHCFVLCNDAEVRFAPKGTIPDRHSEVIPGSPFTKRPKRDRKRSDH